jgi:serine/threonine-protein kinase
MPLLVVEKGPDKGKSVPLVTGGTVLIGRDSSTSLPLHDTMASRMHCKIQSRDDGYWLSDLESMNGTYVNGEKAREPVKLEIGDLIKIGDTLFTFTSEETYSTTLTGQRIGGYRIIERVGRGGMGTVYKAEQVDLQRIVALKVISEEHTKDKEFVELFIHEARAAAKLNHPNVVQVYDVKRHNEYYYFSMEFVSGGSVQEILNQKRKIPWQDALGMLLDSARGLDYAHRKGIVHRDVKPDNLMIAETGMVKIGDMGLARGLEEKVGPEEETSVIGTPHYIAPEQVLGHPADFRSDIYSLGATAYRMLAGVTPFNAPSVRDLVNKKVREDAASIQEHTPDLPKPLAEIVAKMMARDPERRYQSMGDVIRDLERFERGHTMVGEDGHREATRPVAKLVASRGTLLGAAAAGILLAGGVTAFLLWGSSDDPGQNPAPPTAADPRAADQALYQATRGETERMDPKDPRSVEKVLADFGAVMEKYAGTSAATKAAESRARLEKVLKEAKAQKRLELAEADEISQYRRFVQAFSPGRPDWTAAETAEEAYAELAASDDAKATQAGAEAKSRAAHLARWRGLVQNRKEAFEKAQLRAQASLQGERFRDAWDAMAAFQDDTRKQEPECPFAKDRWRDLFYDEAAKPELSRISSEARLAWTKQEDSARLMARDKNYEGAIKLLDSVIASTVEEVAVKAREVRDGLDLEWAAMTRREEEERSREAALAREKARVLYAQSSLAARDLVLKYDFKGAVAKLKPLADAPGVDEFKERVDRRIQELERAALFKETLLNVIRARNASGTNPYRFRHDYSFKGIEGVLEEADDRSLKIKLGVGGTVELLWSQFDGAEFHDFVRKHWKYGREQRRDANDQCNLAAICMEFGLYERALEEIKVVLDAMADPQYAAAEPVKRFCEEYKARLERGESAEYGEIEAKKRLSRLEQFMASPDTYPLARKEIDLLKARYAKTAAFQAASSSVEEQLQLINRSGGETFNKQLREDRFKAVQTRISEERSVSRQGMADIVARLLRMDDPFERAVHLGSVYAAAGDWRAASAKYSEARRVGDAMQDAGRLRPEQWPLLGSVYGELFRIAVLQKERKDADLVRIEAARRFASPETQAPEEWWGSVASALDTWAEKLLPLEEKRSGKLREDFRAAPEDPARIWALAQSLMDGTLAFQEARGLLVWLLENHPDFPQVQNGNCLYRLGELLFAGRDIREAMRRYQDLQAQHKEHAKVLDSGPTGVKQRLEECYKLVNRMGYRMPKQ